MSRSEPGARIVLVEPNPGGHRFQNAAHVVKLAAEHGAVTLLTSAGAEETDEFAEFMADLPLTVEAGLSGPEPATPELIRAIAAHCAGHDVSTLVIMDGDVALKTWWFAAAKAFRGLRHRPRVIMFLTRYPARLQLAAEDARFWAVRVSKGVLIVLARATGTVHRAVGFAGRDERAGGWLVKRVRDPVVCSAHSRDRAALRVKHGLPADRRIVGIFGGINVRKNPALVLQAVLAAGEDVDLLLAGPMAGDIRAWLDQLPAAERARVLVADGFLPTATLDEYLAASDVVALVMQLEGPSGIMGKAEAADVPVVTAGSKTRDRELARLHYGASTGWTAEAIADGLRTVLSGRAHPPARPELPTGESFAAGILGV